MGEVPIQRLEAKSVLDVPGTDQGAQANVHHLDPIRIQKGPPLIPKALKGPRDPSNPRNWSIGRWDPEMS